MSKYFKIIASSNSSVASDWPVQLATLLGSKPRRLSRWCELGLYGALSCIQGASAKHGSEQFSNEVGIRVYTENSTISASLQAIQQSQEHLPMPFTFMQTQPGQLFNAFGSAIGWHGDGTTISGRSRKETELELIQNLDGSVLIGWVEEVPELISRWLWLESMECNHSADWQILSSIFETQRTAKWIYLSPEGEIFQAQ